MSWQIALLMLPGLVIGLTLHEFAHAWSASLLGDDFARRQGRVSLNPLRHLSPLGTLALFVLPFGWGRPVPVNLYNFKRPRWYYLLSSLAGPAANVLVVAACLGLMHLTQHTFRYEGAMQRTMVVAHLLLRLVAVINVMLATINLLPLPPLDGSKIWPCLFASAKPVSSRQSTWISLAVLVALMSTNALQPIVSYAMNTAMRLAPDADVEIFHDRGDAAVKAFAGNRPAEAEALLSEALELDPRAHEYLYLRATVRAEQKKWSGALEDLNRAIVLDAACPQYYQLRAVVLSNLGRPAEARADESAARKLESSAAHH
jgi:Zn-dependent protease